MDYLSLAGLFFAFVGSIILGLGMIRSKDRIEKESGTYWDGNPFTAHFYHLDRKIGLWGMASLSFGFLVQILSILLH